MTTMAGYSEYWDALAWLGRFHVVAIHFPIALLLSALAAESWSVWRKTPDPAPAVRCCVLLGAAGAVLSTALGWCAAPASYVAVPGSTFFLHRWLGTAAGAWSVGLVVLSEIDQARGRRTRLFRGALLGGALLIGATGHFGGLLSHGTEFFDWPREAAPLRAVQSMQLAAIYQQHCEACHGADGRGQSARAKMPAIPDFSDWNWQLGQTEDVLRRQIESGKPPQMPGFRNKLHQEEINGLAIWVRGLAQAHEGAPRGEPAAEPGPPMAAALERRTPEADTPPDELAAEMPRSLPAAPAAGPASPLPKGLQVQRAAVPATPEAVFKKSCVSCHDADGRGASSREDMHSIPDFTDRKWQKSRNDDQLQKSILDGKGELMPPMKAKLGSVAPQRMVQYVRTFARGTEPRQDSSSPPALYSAPQ